MKDLLIDFGIPVFILAILAGLLFTGADGEVKAMMAASIGYLLHSGVKRKKSG